MIRYFLAIFLLFSLPIFSFAQTITYSELLKENIKDDDLQIIGKVNGNILIFKNAKNDYSIFVYDNEMKLKETVPLDFLPGKTFKVNFIAYPNFTYLIYEYQNKKTVYAAGIKLDEEGKVIGQPVTIDSADVSGHTTNTYTLVNSEDRKKIMFIKTAKQNTVLTLTTTLLDYNLQLIKKASRFFYYNEEKNILDNPSLDNDGDFVCTLSSKMSEREHFNELALITKSAMTDSFTTNNIELKGRYTNTVFLKVDNINKHYILNTFFYTERKGNAQGILANVWDKESNAPMSNTAIIFSDTVKTSLKKEGRSNEAFNNFIIRKVITQKDGGYILMAEDYFMLQATVNNYYNQFYNPMSPFGFNNTQTINTYYAKNIFVVNIDKQGKPAWNNVVIKNQYSEINDDALSFSAFTTGGEIHVYYNQLVKKVQSLSDNSIKPDGEIIQNADINPKRDYAFLPKYAKQVGAKQFIIPCVYHNSTGFVKIDY
jgi:hypothetical protein